MKYNSFRPGQEWLDTSGKPIQAHGFSVFYSEQDATYYWYGENKEKTTGGPFNKVWHWGVRCYASRISITGRIRASSFRPNPMIWTAPCIRPIRWTAPTSSSVRKPANMWRG